MTIDEVTEFIESLGGVLTLRPRPDDGSPEIAWGDRFFYYAPDGVLPPGQPFATVVTKDYPDEPPAGLHRPGAFRVNVAAGKDALRARFGRDPRDPAGPAGPDVVAVHPTYGSLGWLAVVDPGPASGAELADLLRIAHDAARSRYRRRHPD